MFRIKLGIERLFEGADIAGGLDRVIGELEVRNVDVRLVIRAVNKSVIMSVDRSGGRLVCRSFGRSFNRYIGASACLSVG